MARPDWLPPLTKKQEQLRALHGLLPARDGWYKTVDWKKRYIAKPMPLEAVVELLPARIGAIRSGVKARVVEIATGSMTIGELAQMFLDHLWQRVESGVPKKLARRTYDDYREVLERFLAAVRPNQLACKANPMWFSQFVRTHRQRAASTRMRDIGYLTAFFNWAGPGRHGQNFYDRPVQFGPDFRKPSLSEIRTELAKRSTLYTPEQFDAALDAAAPCPMLFAVGLLGLNCAFLPIDLATIPLRAIDLDAGIHHFPRGKTGLPRSAVLMPETIAAIRRYLEVRPAPRSNDEPLFVREDGQPFCALRSNRGPDEKSDHGNPIARYWSDVTGLTLKGLRTTFATEADGCHDQAAVDLVMGHAATSIRARHYVKSFDPERLRSAISLVWRRFAGRTGLQVVAPIAPHALAMRRRSARKRDALAKLQVQLAGSGTADATRSRSARPERGSSQSGSDPSRSSAPFRSTSRISAA
jgi:integrase